MRVFICLVKIIRIIIKNIRIPIDLKYRDANIQLFHCGKHERPQHVELILISKFLSPLPKLESYLQVYFYGLNYEPNYKS